MQIDISTSKDVDIQSGDERISVSPKRNCTVSIDVDVTEIVDQIGAAELLDAIGEDEAIKHFNLEIAE